MVLLRLLLLLILFHPDPLFFPDGIHEQSYTRDCEHPDGSLPAVGEKLVCGDHPGRNGDNQPGHFKNP